MSKATYRIKENKDNCSFTYSGDLGEAIEKARKDLQKEKDNPDVSYWLWIKDKAEKALGSHYNRIHRIEAFIKCAQRQLDNDAKEGKSSG